MNLLNPPLNLLRPPKFVPNHCEPSSITEQGLDVRIVDYGTQQVPGVDFFNAGLVNFNGRDWLLSRRSKYDPKIWLGKNDVVAFGLTNLVPQIGYPLKPKHIIGPSEHFEDSRAIVHGGHAWISCCNFVWYAEANLWTGAHQVLLKFDKNWKCVERYDPVYGFNIDKVSAKMGAEKNWLWFFHKGELHMVYRTHPHAVVVFDEKVKYLRETTCEWDNSRWCYGEMRGGTPPVLVGDNYWSFFHSSVPMGANLKRRYYMGAYCFQAKPPFKAVGYTPEPLLVGSKKDRWSVGKPACIFPCGSLFRNGEWIISGGVNDFDTFIAKVSHSELERRVIPCP